MDLRRKLIREVLDSDKNINKQVAYIQFLRTCPRMRWHCCIIKWIQKRSKSLVSL